MTAIKNPNPNHPKRGASTVVSPIRRPTDIQAISRLLKDSPRDRLLFLMGINNGLRCGDLLKLKACQRSFKSEPFSVVRIEPHSIFY